MEKLSSEKTQKTFRDDLFSNVFEIKNDYLDTSEWLAKPYSLSINLDLANTFTKIETNPVYSITNDITNINHGLDSFIGINPNLFYSTILTTGSNLLQTMIDDTSQTILSLNSTTKLETSSIITALDINHGLDSFAGSKISTIINDTESSFTGVSVFQSIIDNTQQFDKTSFFTPIVITPQISTELLSSNNIIEEYSDHEKIEKLENKYSKLADHIKKLSKKIDDISHDVHDSGEYVARQFNILSADVDVLTALVENDED